MDFILATNARMIFTENYLIRITINDDRIRKRINLYLK